MRYGPAVSAVHRTPVPHGVWAARRLPAAGEWQAAAAAAVLAPGAPQPRRSRSIAVAQAASRRLPGAPTAGAPGRNMPGCFPSLACASLAGPCLQTIASGTGSLAATRRQSPRTGAGGRLPLRSLQQASSHPAHGCWQPPAVASQHLPCATLPPPPPPLRVHHTAGGCTTPPCSGTSSGSEWRCCASPPSSQSTGRRAAAVPPPCCWYRRLLVRLLAGCGAVELGSPLADPSCCYPRMPAASYRLPTYERITHVCCCCRCCATAAGPRPPRLYRAATPPAALPPHAGGAAVRRRRGRRLCGAGAGA